MTRQDGRAYDELRPIKITTDFVKFAEGSCLIECGDTKVLCCASVEEKTPPHVAEGEARTGAHQREIAGNARGFGPKAVYGNDQSRVCRNAR